VPIIILIILCKNAFPVISKKINSPFLEILIDSIFLKGL
jgi:hypothetical protein